MNPHDPADRPAWVDDIDNPYLHGPYTPVISEITAVDLKVAAGEIPPDLYGAYFRNGPNPVLPPRGVYHWFDGDGMVHGVYFRDGRASYIRKWIQTRALRGEIASGRVDLSGVMGPFDLTQTLGRESTAVNSDYCKDTSNTTLTLHNGQASVGLVQCRPALSARPGDSDDGGRGKLRRLRAHDHECTCQDRPPHRRVDRL